MKTRSQQIESNTQTHTLDTDLNDQTESDTTKRARSTLMAQFHTSTSHTFLALTHAIDSRISFNTPHSSFTRKLPGSGGDEGRGWRIFERYGKG